MKTIVKILIWVIAFFVAAFLILTLVVSHSAKGVIISQVEKNLNIKADLNRVRLDFPLSLNLVKFELAGLASIDEIKVYPSLLGFLTGKVVLNRLELINPVINLKRGIDGTLNLPSLPKGGKTPPVIVTALTVKNGRFVFNDKKVNPEGFKLTVDKVDLEAAKTIFPPTSLKISFRGSSVIANDMLVPSGEINLSGWVDLGRKDMDGQVELKGIELTLFSPYYGDLISEKKLISGKMDLVSDLKAKNNDLKIISSLKLFKMVYAQEEQKEGAPSDMDIFKNTLDFFTDEQGDLNLEFIINTKLDQPVLSPADIKGIILAAAVKNLSRQRPQAIIDKVTGNIEQFKALGKELEQIFKNKK